MTFAFFFGNFCPCITEYTVTCDVDALSEKHELSLFGLGPTLPSDSITVSILFLPSHSS
jgi:hypothetical protein